MMERLCLPVGMLQANAYLVWEGHDAVLIDPGAEPERLLRAVRERALQLHALLLTHAHFDHILAASEIKEQTGAALIAPQGEAAALADPSYNLSDMVRSPCTLTADRLVSDGEELIFGALTFSVIHTPGHTAGGVCYRSGDLLFTGDTLFAGSVGRTDLPGGSAPALKESLRRLMAIEEDLTVLPGHGEESRLLVEKTGNPFMSGL